MRSCPDIHNMKGQTPGLTFFRMKAAPHHFYSLRFAFCWVRVRSIFQTRRNIKVLISGRPSFIFRRFLLNLPASSAIDSGLVTGPLHITCKCISQMSIYSCLWRLRSLISLIILSEYLVLSATSLSTNQDTWSLPCIDVLCSTTIVY